MDSNEPWPILCGWGSHLEAYAGFSDSSCAVQGTHQVPASLIQLRLALLCPGFWRLWQASSCQAGLHYFILGQTGVHQVLPHPSLCLFFFLTALLLTHPEAKIIPIFFFNKPNYFHVIYFISLLSIPTSGVILLLLFLRVFFFFFFIIVCITKPRLKTLWRPPRHCLSALEFSFSLSQPHPQLPVGSGQRAPTAGGLLASQNRLLTGLSGNHKYPNSQAPTQTLSDPCLLGKHSLALFSRTSRLKWITFRGGNIGIWRKQNRLGESL